MNSDPRENREDVHKSVPDSGTPNPDDSTTPDEEQLRNYLRSRGWELTASTGEERREDTWEGVVEKGGAELTASSGEEPVTPSGAELSTSSDKWDMTPPPLIAPGEVLFGKYRLDEQIGGGGMGSVWKVWNLDMECERALKLIKPEIAQNDKRWRRFRREAQLMEKIKHPGAVRVYDCKRTQGLGYIEMEFVRGRSLDQILRSNGGKPMPLDWTAQVVEQICAVLQEAHGYVDEKTGALKPIIHCDLKPSNLMLIESKHPRQAIKLKVLDFSIAKMIEDEGGGEQTLTAAGDILGTPAYMSPEQIKGGFEKEGDKPSLDGRSDLYSTGVVLYHLLTGVRPFRGSSMAMIGAHLNLAPPTMKESNPDAKVPPEVERVVMQCLEKDPANRPQSARELSDRFRKAIGKMKTDHERPMREETATPTGSASPARGPSGPKGLFMGLLARLGRSLKEAVSRSASAARPGLDESKLRVREEPLPVREVPATIRRRADLSFPAQVVVGKPYHLSVRLVPIEGDSPGGLTNVAAGPRLDDWMMSFLVPFISSSPPPGAPLPRIKVFIIVAAENFEIDGTDRAEILVPLQGDSPAVQFSLRGKDVGPGRVMIDFAQGGRPTGSVDLTSEVVTPFHDAVRKLLTSNSAAPAGGGLILNLATGPFPAPPDLVIKVFEHRLAGHPGRLQFVLSSTHRALSDLPVFDGDLGTLDLRTEVGDWVSEQLRAVGTLAGQPDVTAEEFERTLTHIGCNLFQQLLPAALQNLCCTFCQRGVRTVMILSDEPHIPWELIKPFQIDPATGAIVTEYPFWGESFALTHWLRGRPPAPRLSIRSVVTMAAGSAHSRFRSEQQPECSVLPGPTPADIGPETMRDMIVTGSASSAKAENPLQAVTGPTTTEESPICTPGSNTDLPELAAAEEELELLRLLESRGSTVARLPARWKALQSVFENGGFDLFHLASHSTFGGPTTGDASAVLLDDGVFTAAQLSPLMAGPLRSREPLIFFNTCHSGRLGFCPTRLGAWGARLVEFGCGGFIGALWPITDRAAVAFARAFYDLIAQGRPIGEAIQLSRLSVRERFPNDPTWLAYCCFADPMAQVAPLKVVEFRPVSAFPERINH
jgi:serine/threonine protein kinase